MKIKVEPLLPTGSYLNCRIGVEIEIPDDGDMELEINAQWDNIIAIHMKRYPHLYNEKGEPKYEPYKGEEQVKEVQVIKVSDEIQAVLDGIEACTVIGGSEGLGSYWLRSKGNLTLSAAYKEKEKKLTDAK